MATIGRPRTRLSRKVLVTTKSGKTYHRYIYDDEKVMRTRPQPKPVRTKKSAVEAIRNGQPMKKVDFEKKYPEKSYKKYRQKLQKIKERL